MLSKIVAVLLILIHLSLPVEGAGRCGRADCFFFAVDGIRDGLRWWPFRRLAFLPVLPACLPVLPACLPDRNACVSGRRVDLGGRRIVKKERRPV